MKLSEVSQRELATPNEDIMSKAVVVQGPNSVDQMSECTSD
jgi:hypothetical protein